jgi:uncharacterized protein (TIGR02147 family)
MAEAMHCNTAYVAQVLNGSAHFSLEQGEGLISLLGLHDREADYFLLLIQHARAGTSGLRRRLETQIEELRGEQLSLKERFRATHDLGEKEVLEFFSRWYIAAVHLGATIPRLKTRAALSKALIVDLALVEEALDFLLSHELIKEKDGRLEPGPTRIFIGQDSPILKMHHANWRAKAIQNLDRADARDLHFTSVYSLSAPDAAAIREKLVREIEGVRAVVRDSPEEQLHTLTMDFFRLDCGSK